MITSFDCYLLGEGTHFRIFEKLGAHLEAVDGKPGVRFAVWAPNAAGVRLVGDFNSWDGKRHAMRCLGDSGVWEAFVPGLKAGALYKFEVHPKSGAPVQKADPLAFAAEIPPRSASRVCDLKSYRFKDEAWMRERAARDPLKGPVNVYECHLASWRLGEGGRPLSYHELADALIPYVRSMGYTHIEVMPVTEHPFGGSWGYQCIGYFAPTSRHGAPEDFMHFVDRCHQEGLGVILDWVPSHFATDSHGLGRFDGTALYEHEDPREGFHPDWGSYIFNYGRNEVRSFLISSALFWLEAYHIDGLRLDAVASMLYRDYSRRGGEWIPNRHGGRENLEAVEFLRVLNVQCHASFPGVMTIAEESTAWPMVSRPVYCGGLGFSMKWNMGWMHDTLEYSSKDPIHRKHHHDNATFSLLYAYTENFILVLSHDEVVHGKRSLLDKMPGDGWQKFANLRLLYGYMLGHPGKKLLFMGGEFAQGKEWDHTRGLDWELAAIEPHKKMQDYVRALNRLYLAEPALHENDFEPAGFEWIDSNDRENSVFSFLRWDAGRRDCLVFACNFTPVPRSGYRLGVPRPGFYKEILNSDAGSFGGSGLGNKGGLSSEAEPWHGRPHSLLLTLPPLAVVCLKYNNA